MRDKLCARLAKKKKKGGGGSCAGEFKGKNTGEVINWWNLIFVYSSTALSVGAVGESEDIMSKLIWPLNCVFLLKCG